MSDEIVYRCTEEHAIADGVLFRFSEDPDWRQHLMSVGVYAAIQGNNDGRTFAQKAMPLLMDVALAIRNKPATKRAVRLVGNVTQRDELWVAPNGLGGITVFFLEDD